MGYDDENVKSAECFCENIKNYIETLIRERFIFGKKNEQIYIIQNNDTKN